MHYTLALTQRVDGTNAPLTLAQAKEHLRVDGTAEDDYIQAILDAAIEKVEQDMSIILQRAEMVMRLARWPGSEQFVLPVFPLAEVTEITYLEDGEDNPTTLNSDLYRAELDSVPPRIVMKKDRLFPSDSLETGYPIAVSFIAGYADDAWNTKAVHAIRLLLGHWYLHREAVATGTIATEIPQAYEALVLGGRQW